MAQPDEQQHTGDADPPARALAVARHEAHAYVKTQHWATS